MKNPMEYIEILIKRLERKIFFYIAIIITIIIGIVFWSSYKTSIVNLSEISFNNKSVANKAFCITANTKMTDYVVKQEDNIQVLKNEKFSCYKDMETCYENISVVWYDIIDFLSDYYKIEDVTITKSKKYSANKNQLINAWWENNMLKVYCLEVIVSPVKEGKEND